MGLEASESFKKLSIFCQIFEIEQISLFVSTISLFFLFLDFFGGGNSVRVGQRPELVGIFWSFETLSEFGVRGLGEKAGFFIENQIKMLSISG